MAVNNEKVRVPLKPLCFDKLFRQTSTHFIYVYTKVTFSSTLF